MKKKILFFVCTVFLSAGFVSCNKDDDGDSNASIVGKWEFYKTSEYLNGEVVYEEMWSDISLCPSKKDYVKFESNGDFMQVNHDEDCEAETEMGTYTFSGNTLEIDSGFDIMSLDIVSITGSKLIVEEQEVYEGITYKYRTELRK